jgi:hypothetical protein
MDIGIHQEAKFLGRGTFGCAGLGFQSFELIDAFGNAAMQAFAFCLNRILGNGFAADLDILPIQNKSPTDHETARCAQPGDNPADACYMFIGYGLVFWRNLQTWDQDLFLLFSRKSDVLFELTFLFFVELGIDKFI